MSLAFSLFGNLGLKTQDLETGSKKAKAELQSLTATTTAGIGGLTTALTGLAAGAIGLGALKSGLTDILKTGQDMERLRTTFTAITGSVQAGRQELQFVTDTANRQGLSITSLVEQYRSLTAATRGTSLAGQDTRELFTALSTASRTYGLSTEQTGRALLAFQQIISKGKVSQEELRGQLGEALPGASQIAARAFGVTTQELDKMVEKGIDAGEFTRRFTAQLQRETPDALNVVGKGIANLGNELVLWKDRMAQSGVLAFIDKLAAAGANLLKSGRVAGEQTSEQVQRNIRIATGDRIQMSPANLERFTEITERLTQAEAQAGDMRLRPDVRQRAAAQIKALQAEQGELLARITEDEARRRGVENRRAGLDLTPAEERTEIQRQETDLKRLEEERVRIRRAEIDVETDKKIKAEEEFERVTEEGAKKDVQLRRQVGDAQQAYLEGLQKEVELQTMGVDWLKRKELATQALEPEQRKQAEAFLVELETLKDITAEREFMVDVEKAVRDEQEETAKALEKIRDRVNRDIEREDTARLRQQERMADRLGDALLQPFEDLATGSEVSFQQIAQSFSRMILQMTIEASGLKKALNDLIQKGIGVLGGLVTPTTGTTTGVSETTAPTFTPEVSGSFASGGPMMPNRFYQVHQDELIYSGSTGGTVIPAAQARQMGGVTVHMTVITEDAGSFLRSSAQVERAMLSLTQRATRNG